MFIIDSDWINWHIWARPQKWTKNRTPLPGTVFQLLNPFQMVHFWDFLLICADRRRRTETGLLVGQRIGIGASRINHQKVPRHTLATHRILFFVVVDGCFCWCWLHAKRGLAVWYSAALLCPAMMYIAMCYVSVPLYFMPLSERQCILCHCISKIRRAACGVSANQSYSTQ